jgi:hypothetical protein
MSLEEAKQKHNETGGVLCELAKERNALPGQIQSAANAGDSETLAKLSARKVAIEAEITAATVADREAQIAIFVAELTEASARATELTNALPTKAAELQAERQDLHRRLENNGKDESALFFEETRARQAVDDLRVKIEGARQALTQYENLRAERAAA